MGHVSLLVSTYPAVLLGSVLATWLIVTAAVAWVLPAPRRGRRPRKAR